MREAQESERNATARFLMRPLLDLFGPVKFDTGRIAAVMRILYWGVMHWSGPTEAMRYDGGEENHDCNTMRRPEQISTRLTMTHAIGECVSQKRTWTFALTRI